VHIEQEATPTTTGALEVTVDGKLVHSKKGGDGYVDTDAKLDKILAAVGAAVSAAGAVAEQ
jgi:selT/selW/selH-like putative selenoprotein